METNTKYNQINCIIDARVSTDKQLFGRGLDDQEAICIHTANSKAWNIVNIFAKSYSGRKEEREDFAAILKYIRECQKRGIKIEKYLFKSIDRFTRSGGYELKEMKTKIQALGVTPVDAYGLMQPEQNTLAHHGVAYEWSMFSPSEAAEWMEAHRGESEVRDILTRMIGAEVALVREGYSIRNPLDGYKNAREVINYKEHPVHAIDEERAPFFRRIFELRAAGKFSDQEIVDAVNALGFKTKPKHRWRTDGKRKWIVGTMPGKPLTVKQLQKLIKRTMYAGVKHEKWNQGNPVWAVFAEGSQPIVSVDTFNRANRGSIFIRVKDDGNPRVLYDYTEPEPTVKIRKKYHPEYAYDKMILCNVCKRPLKNSGKGNKGKLGKYYKGYHCDRSAECKRVTGRIPKEVYEARISSLLSKIEFSDAFRHKLEDTLLKAYRKREQDILDQSITVADTVTNLKKEQAALLEDFSATDSLVVKRLLEDKLEKLEKRINGATDVRDKIEISERDIKAFVKSATNLVEHPVKALANNRNPLFQKALFDLVFEEPPTYAHIVSGTPKLSFIFKLSGANDNAKSPLVTPEGLGWNTLESLIQKWNRVHRDFQAA